jgi:hypothetical protein
MQTQDEIGDIVCNLTLANSSSSCLRSLDVLYNNCNLLLGEPSMNGANEAYRNLSQSCT